MAVKKFSLEAVIDLTDKMTKPMQNVEKKMLGFSKTMQKNFGGVGNNLKSLDNGINKLAVGAVVGTAAIGAGAIAVGKSFVEAAAEVQNYKAVLTTLLGSQDAANKRFDEMTKFSAKTPFDLPEVVELGNKLQTLGKYSLETMTNLGDLAAASKKPVEQVANAFAKMVTGQKGEAVNMFRDLGIGPQDWIDATGKGIKKTGELIATTDELLAAIPKILDKKRITGMMAEISKTHDGIVSNFRDTIFQFRAGMGSGLLKPVDKIIVALTGRFSELSDVTQAKTKKAMESIGVIADKIAKWITEFDIAKFIDGVVGFLTTIKNAWNFIKPILPFLLIVVVEIKLIVAAMAIYNGVMAVAAVVTNGVLWPVVAVIAGIALLTIGIIALVKNWNAVKKFFGDFGNGILFALGPLGQLISMMTIVISSFAGIGAAFKNGGFIEGIKAIGATLIQVLIKPLAQLFSLLSRIPAVGGAFSGIANGLTSASSGLDMAINGHKDNYVNPSTRTAASSSTTTTTRNVVDLQAPKGWGMMPQGYGGIPRQTLNFGGAQ